MTKNEIIELINKIEKLIGEEVRLESFTEKESQTNINIGVRWKTQKMILECKITTSEKV